MQDKSFSASDLVPPSIASTQIQGRKPIVGAEKIVGSERGRIQPRKVIGHCPSHIGMMPTDNGCRKTEQKREMIHRFDPAGATGAGVRLEGDT